MVLESNVLTFLENNPRKYTTIIEIVNAVFKVDLTNKDFIKVDDSKIWDVISVLNSLFKTGKINMKVLASKKALGFKIKKKN